MLRILTSIALVLHTMVFSPAKAEEAQKTATKRGTGPIITVARALHLRSKYISYSWPARRDRPQLFTSIEKSDDVGIDGGRGGDTRFLIGLEWRLNFLQ